MAVWEPGSGSVPRLTEILGEMTSQRWSQAIVAFFFATTGPLVILLQAGHLGHQPTAVVNSWIFSGYAIGGLLTWLMTLYYRQPIGIAWTIPGGVLAGAALTHLPLDQVVGAYLVTGLFILVLGLTGWIRAIMALLPLPIIMGMVAGVFLPFGLNIITAFQGAPLISAVTFVVFLGMTRMPHVARRFPPILGAIIAGFATAAASGHLNWGHVAWQVVSPRLFAPRFSLSAILELVLPLTVTVIGIQNAQGIAVLRQAGFRPPVNAMTIICGVGSLVMGGLGWVSACVTGPVNAILCDDAEPKGRYVGALIWGALLVLFGLLAPVVSGLWSAIPAIFVGMLAGLAMMHVLAGSFQGAFSGPLRLGALFAFLITVSNLSIFRIGAPFWGLVGGTLISLVLERKEFLALVRPAGAVEEVAAAQAAR